MYRRPKALDGKTRIGDSDLNSAKFNKMYKILGDSLLSWLTLYADGKFNEVSQLLSLDTFNAVSLQLYNQTTTSRSYKDFERYRVVFTQTLRGLRQSILQYITLEQTKGELETCEEKAAILDDMELLQEYLANLSRSFDLLPEQFIYAQIAPNIKEPYNTYIQRHSYPSSGVFDPDKLAAIMLELGITPDDTPDDTPVDFSGNDIISLSEGTFCDV